MHDMNAMPNLTIFICENCWQNNNDHSYVQHQFLLLLCRVHHCLWFGTCVSTSCDSLVCNKNHSESSVHPWIFAKSVVVLGFEQHESMQYILSHLFLSCLITYLFWISFRSIIQINGKESCCSSILLIAFSILPIIDLKWVINLFYRFIRCSLLGIGSESWKIC